MTLTELVAHLREEVEKAAHEPRAENAFSRGLNAGYMGAYAIVAGWIEDAMEYEEMEGE